MNDNEMMDYIGQLEEEVEYLRLLVSNLETILNGGTNENTSH